MRLAGGWSRPGKPIVRGAIIVQRANWHGREAISRPKVGRPVPRKVEQPGVRENRACWCRMDQPGIPKGNLSKHRRAEAGQMRE